MLIRNNPVFLGLGSNLGDRLHNIVTALNAIAECANPLAVSRVYETDPVGFADQPLFLNAVCAIETYLQPRQLLESSRAIERSLGRTPTERWHPREIDVDILATGHATMSEPDLRIPHPRAHERLFVCRPFADLAPSFVLPGQHCTMAILRDSLVDGPAVNAWMGGDELIKHLCSTAWKAVRIQPWG